MSRALCIRLLGWATPAAAVLPATSVTVGAGTVAFANARCTNSAPTSGATLAAPMRVSVTYSQLLTPSGSTLSVVDAPGATVSQDASQVASDQHAMQVALRPGLGVDTNGARWQDRLAEDGGADQGSVIFRVGPGGAAPGPAAGGGG